MSTRRTRRWGLAVVVLVASQLALLPAHALEPGPDDQVYPRGDAGFYGSTGAAQLPKSVTGMSRTPSGLGYRLVTSDGSVYAFGDAGYHGSAGFFLAAPIVDIETTPSGNGYWLVLRNGGVFTFGDAGFYGSMGGGPLAGNVVSIHRTPSGFGYWIVSDQGGVYPFGDAGYYSSMAGIPLNHPIVDFAARPAGDGYWLLARDGGVFSFGSAGFYGSPASTTTVAAAAFARTSTGNGYWIAGTDGRLFAHGDATAFAGVTAPARPIVDVVATPTNAGLWLAGEGNGPAPAGAIAGTVTDDLGSPAPGVCVNVWAGYPSYTSLQATTGADGGYRVDGLDPGGYSVYAYDCVDQDYLSANPGTVTVASAQTTDVSFSVPRASSVEGVVTDPSGQPIAGVCVNVMEPDRQWGSSAITSVTGYYRAGGLRASTYHVEFNSICYGGSAQWATEWWDDQPTESTADGVTVATGEHRAKVDAQMAPAAEISGVVTSEGTGQPVESVCVSAHDDTGAGVAGGSTSVTGFYRIAGLAADTYTVEFSDCYIYDGGSFAPEWWNDKGSRSDADPVTTTAGNAVTGIDAALAEGGTIAGTVTDLEGGLLQDMCVRAYDPDGVERAYATTSVTGTYRLGGLGSISYKVRADDCLQARYGYEWYDEQGTRADATPVPVTPGATTDGIDFSLSPPGTISGTVTDAAGNGIQWACVDTHDAGGARLYGTFTSVTGFYRVHGLRAGSYTVHFDDCSGGGLPDEWWDDAPDQGSATPIPVTAGGEAVADAVLGAPASPGAPTNVAAVAGNGSADVTWNAPSSDGGSAVTGYTVTASPGGTTATTSGATTTGTTPASTSVTVSGLANDTTYTFTVRATNAVGDSPESAPSNPATPTAPPDTVPGAPTNVTGTPGDQSVTVSWTAPLSDGGDPISHYTATASPGGATATTTGTSVTFGGLANGTTYTFTVRATNGVGDSPESSPTHVTPATVPDAPTNVAATRGNGAADVSWSAPAFDGGSSIGSYTVTASPGGTTTTTSMSTVTPTVPTSVTVTGLANGTSYTFTVVATNSMGDSPASAPSNAVTPATVPSAPTGVTAKAGNGSATVTWIASASNGGNSVTGYTVTSSGGTTATTSGTSTTVTGLSGGTSYTFTVVATNGVGNSPASAPSNAVTVKGKPPRSRQL